jgi:hypothetical protein
MKTFTVRLHYTGYYTQTIQAENEDDALQEAREAMVEGWLTKADKIHEEIKETLEPWKEADEATEQE